MVGATTSYEWGVLVVVWLGAVDRTQVSSETPHCLGDSGVSEAAASFKVGPADLG
jgi:hypothetical protein